MTRAVRYVLAALVAVLGGAVLLPSPAYGHGEETQQAFVRTSTVVLHDVKFSTTKLNVGEDLVITGKARIMNAWPEHTVGEPEIGFLSVVAPGPKFLVKERVLNGMGTPQSVKIHKGATYDFLVRLTAKEEGRWHVHPSFSVEETGTLVGRGEWIDVGPGEISNDATLATGGDIDLLTFGLDRVILWQALGVALALGWLLLWLRKPIIARNALVEEARGGALIKRSNLIAGGVVGVLAFGLLLGGYAVTKATLPEPLLPVQVARVEPEPSKVPPALIESTIDQAAWDESQDELTFTVSAENKSRSTVRLTSMQMAESEFRDSMTIDGDSVIEPGQESTFTVAVAGPFLREHNLLPLHEAQVRVTGLLFFEDEQGREQVTEVNEVTSPVLPTGESVR